MRKLLILLSIFPALVLAQVQVEFKPLLNGKTIELGKDKEGMLVETFRFYISHLQLKNKGKLVWSEKNNPYLLDVEEPSSFIIPLTAKILEFDEFTFALGIDSLTNVSGVMGGDLDPTKGMYWSWQSGYINFKLEGYYTKNQVKTEFRYHLGGYSGDKNCFQMIHLQIKSSDKIVVKFEVLDFITQIDESDPKTIMSPGIKAVHLAKIAASTFKGHEN